jgi:acyl-CoA thioester hydrolase
LTIDIDPTVSAATNPASVRIQRRVELTDTDSTGHYHHSTVIRWVEAAEYVLHQRIGLGDLPVLPRVRYEADYRERVWRNELIDVDLAVRSVGRSSVSYGFKVRRHENICAAGSMTVVLTDTANGRSTPWPDDARRALLNAGAQAPELLGSSSASPDAGWKPADSWGIGYG